MATPVAVKFKFGADKGKMCSSPPSPQQESVPCGSGLLLPATQHEFALEPLHEVLKAKDVM